MKIENIKQEAQNRCDKRFSYLHNSAFLMVLLLVLNGESTQYGIPILSFRIGILTSTIVEKQF